MNPMYTFVYSEDWIAVYDVDGNEVMQNNTISAEAFLEETGVTMARIWAGDRFNDGRYFPGHLREVITALDGTGCDGQSRG